MPHRSRATGYDVRTAGNRAMNKALEHAFIPQALSADLLQKMHAYWRAANYLSVGQIYLKDNPLLEEPLDARAHQAPSAGPLGHDAGVELSLCPSEPADQRERSEHDLRHRSRPWRPGHGGADLSRRVLYRALSGDRARAGTDCSGCSASSPGLTAFPATSRRKRPARSTRAASWAIRWSTPMARPSTIPI